MAIPTYYNSLFLLLLILLVVYNLPLITHGQLVPALFIFGDSVVDVGNNNGIATTIVKANFPPYGRDFANHTPTGRFSNGKIAPDYIADFLGFSTYPPAYLSREAKGTNLLTGANFASGASGFYDSTATSYNAIPLSKQLDNYREYQKKLSSLIGNDNATTTFSKGIHLISSGNSDYIQNYYINPLLRLRYTPDRFADLLVTNFANFVKELYGLGARKIGVTSLAPIGCLPGAITLFGGLSQNKCVESLNNDALSFNTKLNSTSIDLQNQLSGLKLIVFDTYQPLADVIQNYTQNGFVNARNGCCAVGLIETSFLCNPGSIGTCKNASQYVFWDAFHPSQATNELLSNSLAYAGAAFLDD